MLLLFGIIIQKFIEFFYIYTGGTKLVLLF